MLTVEKVWKKPEHVDVGHAVQDGDPADQELAHERVQHVHALAQQRDELLDAELVALRHDVLRKGSFVSDRTFRMFGCKQGLPNDGWKHCYPSKVVQGPF